VILILYLLPGFNLRRLREKNKIPYYSNFAIREETSKKPKRREEMDACFARGNTSMETLFRIMKKGKLVGELE